MEARRMSTSIWSVVRILLEVLADFKGPLDARVRMGLPESSIIAQLGDGLGEIRDTSGATKEAMAGIVPESRLEWGLGAKGDQAPKPTC